MAEESFPVVEQPMSADQWRSVTSGIGDGVLDEGGSPYTLVNISNASNTAEVSVSSSKGYAHAILKGFYHKIDANLTLDIPAVTTATTYYIALQYDPVRATSGDLPVKLDAYTSLDRSQGKEYLVLYEIDRAPDQLLTDAPRRWVRARVSPSIVVSRGRELPNSANTMRWATAFIHGGGTGVTDIRVNSESGWRSLLNPAWEELPDVSSATSGTSGYRLAIQRTGTQRKMRGRFRRASGADYLASNSDGYIIAYLGSNDTPTATSRHWVYGGGDTLAYVTFYAGNGQIRVNVTKNCNWIDLGTIEWSVPEVN